jgi:hypothetical protein
MSAGKSRRDADRLDRGGEKRAVRPRAGCPVAVKGTVRPLERSCNAESRFDR